MLRKHLTRNAKRGATLMAVALAVMIPFAAFAQASTDTTATADATTQATMPNRTMGGNGGMSNNNSTIGIGTVDTTALTDEQKTVYAQALALYEGVEDQVLADLVTAGVVTQTDADAYIALREAEKTLTDLDQSAWTATQYKAYYEANAKTGDERMQAMQALADAGQLTQAQADALGAQGENDLWTMISANAGTNSAIQQAINTVQQARNTMQETLRNAGITTMGMGGGLGLGNDQSGKGFGGRTNQNGNNYGQMPGNGSQSGTGQNSQTTP
ncbi:MAG: hypothetical protein LLF96_09260 [Eubacteriales bacterium]|nr:hypothetical protein [Eubacteriales bacterium]